MLQRGSVPRFAFFQGGGKQGCTRAQISFIVNHDLVIANYNDNRYGASWTELEGNDVTVGILYTLS